MRQILDADPHDAIPDLLHRLRNPLLALRSGVTLVMHVAHPSGEALSLLNAMLEEVARIDRTAQDTQRFFRLTAGDPQPVSVMEAVREARAAQQQAADASGIEVVPEGGNDERALVDRKQLLFALSELLDNAIRFSPPGGRVRVAWHTGGNGFVTVEVEDSGEGVPTSYAEQVGKPFFSTLPERTGLGLAAVSRICRLAGGRLAWENVARGGACFSMALPVG